MRFFNLGNEQTFHVFTWLTQAGEVDTGELVRQAFEAVETDEWFTMDLDVSLIAQDTLAELLTELLEGYMSDFDLDLKDWPIGDVGVCDVNGPGKTRSLFMPILWEALSRINYSRLAEAILVSHKKWNPEKTLPKLLGSEEAEEDDGE